jgi:hypothetical protein
MKSLTKDGLTQLITKLLTLAKEKGHDGRNLTSHDLQATFTDSQFTRKNGDKYGSKLGFNFHPKVKFKDCFSEEMPAVVITYSKARFCLVTHLLRFLDVVDKRLGSDPNRTFWLDIFCSDRNHSKDIDMDLKESAEMLKTVRYHVVFMYKHTLSCGWCLANISIRIEHIMKSRGLSEEDVADKILNGDSDFPVAVIVPDLTELGEELWSASSARFEDMTTFSPNDKIKIQQTILDFLHDKESFEYLMLLFSNAVLGNHAKRHPVRSVAVCPADCKQRMSAACMKTDSGLPLAPALDAMFALRHAVLDVQRPDGGVS